MVTTSRKRLPLGIAQIGKSFRNEITRNFTFRTREFEQMEMEFFVKPGTDGVVSLLDGSVQVVHRPRYPQGKPSNEKSELAHYAKACADVRSLPVPDRLVGTRDADRAVCDLTQHAKWSGKDLSYFDSQTNERYIPHVIEPSAGADRSVLAFLVDAYREEDVEGASGGLEAASVACPSRRWRFRSAGMRSCCSWRDSREAWCAADPVR